MQRPTKLVLVGVMVAVLIGLAGWINLLRLEGNLHAAQVKCERQSKADFKGAGFQLDCEPSTLTTDRFNVGYVKPPGVQGEIIDAQQALWGHSADAFAIAAICAVIFFSIPWCWYFMLRRLREVGDAVRGR
jgi:hypothetical protein